MNEASRQFACHTVSPGVATGEALISADPILFYHTDPKTGVITEEGHALFGKSVAGKILVFPGGKGSSVVQADGLYQLLKHGTAPVGFLVRTLDTVLVSTAVIMELPMADAAEEAFYAHVRDGAPLRLDAQNGVITLL